MRIDAHQHFWNLAARRGAWPGPELAALHRDFAPHDLQPWLERCGIDGTVLVQSLPSVDDTLWMLGLAQRHPFILGVVGWVDLMATDACERIGMFARHPKLVGLRPMLQDLPDPQWIADPRLATPAEAMAAHGLAFDALVRPEHLPALLGFAQHHPALRIVIDHAAKPDISGAVMAPWQADIAALARLPNVYCKLSGLLTEAGPRPQAAQLRPCVAHVFSCFGPERILWGSDWPVVELVCDYGQWLAAAQSLCAEAAPQLTPAQVDAIFGGNAVRFYRLKAPAA